MIKTSTITKSIAAILLLFSALLQTGDGLSAATGTLMPTPYQTSWDSNGNPVSGSCVWTYVAGTSTPVATYTDSALTTPNSNPIVADSAGRFVAWLSAGSSYKFTYETACTAPAHGSVLKTVDNVLAVPGTSNPTTTISTVDLRLTLTNGTAVTTADVTAATAIWVNPFRGNRIALYDGATWNLRTVTATSITVPATTSQMYDVFVYDSATTPTYETLAWTNDSTRATALTTQDGVLVKTGDATRRFIASFRTTTVSGQTEDSFAKRFVWNYYNRVRRPLRVIETTDSWTYSTSTIRQANGNTANQVAVVIGWAEVEAAFELRVTSSNNAAGNSAGIGIGEDSTTTFAANSLGGRITSPVGNYLINHLSLLRKYPAAGYHFYSWLEVGSGAGADTWIGDNGTPTNYQSGLQGEIEG